MPLLATPSSRQPETTSLQDDDMSMMNLDAMSIPEGSTPQDGHVVSQEDEEEAAAPIQDPLARGSSLFTFLLAVLLKVTGRPPVRSRPLLSDSQRHCLSAPVDAPLLRVAA